jgi:NitT/TauT family transport system substrate-binding protein
MIALAGLIASGCGTNPSPSAAASPAKSTPLSVGYAAISVTQASAWVAKDKGIFSKNGLDVTLQSIPGGSFPTAALISGEIQALQISVEAISAGLEGADIVYVAAPVSVPLFSFVTVPSITDASQLRGKKIAATGIGTASYFAAVIALRHFGLDPLRDVSFVMTGSVPAELGALQSGGVQAAALSMPTSTKAKKLGMRELANVADLGVHYPSSWLAVRRSYINAHRGEVTALVKSITEAIAFELQHPDETKQIVGRYSQITDPQQLSDTYQAVVPYLNRVPRPEAGQVSEALKLLALNSPKAATADPGRFVDPSFVDKLKKDGFIDRLYPRSP